LSCSGVNIGEREFWRRVEAMLSFRLWLKIDADEADLVNADWAESSRQGCNGCNRNVTISHGSEFDDGQFMNEWHRRGEEYGQSQMPFCPVME
jgi:hypothetical protein